MIADFVKLMNGAAGTFAGMTREARETARVRVKETLGGLDFVSREEFEAVKSMAARAREDTIALQTRVAALEAASTATQDKPKAGDAKAVTTIADDTDTAG